MNDRFDDSKHGGGISALPTRELLATRFKTVRSLTLRLADPLSAEDQCVQPMPETSLTKWHLGMAQYFQECDESAWRRAAPLIELGLQHEQQHQELILSDIKYTLPLNPYEAIYTPLTRPAGGAAAKLRWLPCRDGETMIRHAGDDFAFDNERPRHRVLIPPCQIANRPARDI